MSILYAQSTPAAGGGLAAFLPFLLIGLIFYFLILRPQSKQKKEHDLMLENLKKGDNILTRGGVYGKIINFQGKNAQKVIIDIGSDTKVAIGRTYVSGLTKKIEEDKTTK